MSGESAPTVTAADAFRQAVSLHGAGRIDEAEAAYRQVLQMSPGHADAWQLLGVLLARSRRPREGAHAMRRSLELHSEQPVVHANLGNAVFELGEYGDALAHFARALESMPGLVPAWINHGGALLGLGRLEAAVQSCTHAASLAPGYVLPLLHRARALECLGRFDEALADYARALALRPELAETHMSRALLLARCGRYAEAALQLETLARLDPWYDGLQGLRLHLQMCVADWSRWDESAAVLRAARALGHAPAPPFALLAITDSAAIQLECATRYADANRPPDAGLPAGRAPPAPSPHGPHARIRIAYLAADLTEHALSFLMAGVFELHDRRRFETLALALRKDESSAMGRRVRSAFERLIDFEGASDAAIAARVRSEEIDILIDLTGYTSGHRGGVLARRPAPVQVSYLGFPGTLGGSSADYLIADEFVIPETSRAFYAEAIAYLPHCFQANDSRRAAAGEAPSRTSAGLPETAFVWCSFHSSYKINPPLFDIWMRLLERESGGVLWLLLNDEATERNIRREAEARGVDPARIVAAKTLPYPRHLARLALADLCLDTWPFNGGATTSDALFAGVPVLTCAGESFASRMSESLLQCSGLPELVTRDLEQYERTALDLARAPRRLGELRTRLRRNRADNPLFDSALFCRHLEAAYEEMHARRQRGEPPASFKIGSLS
jgi:predicted O-linked N-acetylglucosamine transferase (SPINDLY family)